MKYPIIILATAVAIVSFAYDTCASESTSSSPSSAIELFPPVVVSATGYGENPFRMPYSTAVVTAKWLQQRLPRTMPGALGELPGVMVQKTAHAQGSPYIRGFTGFRTLMLLEGIRLNHSVFREGPNQYWGTVDPFAIERLEVIKGPSSVVHGSDAVGGTVNAVSAGASRGTVQSPAGGRMLYRFASAEDSHTGRLAAESRLNDRVGVRFGTTFKDYGNLRGGDRTGVQPFTGYREYDFDGRFDFRIRENVRISALFQDVTQGDAWRTHTTIYGSTWKGTRPGNDLQRSLDQRRSLGALQLRAEKLAGAIEQVHASVSRQRHREDQLRIRNDRRRDDTGFDVTTLGTFLQLQSRSAIGRWIYGGEFYRDSVDSYNIRYRADGVLSQIDIQGPVADEATYDLAGVYIENRLPRLGPVDLIVGGRFNYAAADAGRMQDPLSGKATSVQDEWRSFVGSARGVVHLGDGERWNAFAGVSQAFRAPNLSDLTRFDIAEGGQIETPAPGLVPEKFLTSEIGLRTRHGRWSAEAAYFYTAIRNQIIRTPTGTRVDGLEEVTKRNSGSGYVHGVELAGRVQLSGAFTLWGNLSWMEGELDYFPNANTAVLVRAPMSRVMPLTGHAGLRWSPGGGAYWVEFSGSVATRQDRLAPGDRVDIERIPFAGTPGYGILSWRAGWRATQSLHVMVAIENLTNEDYRIHGSGLNEPGRNLIVSADFRF